MSVDYRKVVSYPPEIIPFAQPIDLIAGDNRVFEYTGMDQPPSYVVSLYGASFARVDGLKFWVDADGAVKVVSVDDLGAARGLDYTEEFKVPACKNMFGYIYSPASIASYQMRHAVRVDRPNALLKLQLGFPLSRRDEELVEKYGLRELVATQSLLPFDPYAGIQQVKTYAKTLSSPGVVLRLPVPKGFKAVLLDVAMERPTSPNVARLTLERDRQGYDVFELDPYCLQGLEQPLRFDRLHSIRIVCLSEMLVELDVSSGTHKVRLVVGLGKLTIPEKIRWNIELSPEEKATADRLNLYEQVEAGIA